MLSLCVDDDELGMVLSHEIVHCLLSHAAEKLSYVNMINFALLIPLAVLWSLLPNDGIAVMADWFCRQVIDVAIELPFSRRMETEADEVGLLLASSLFRREGGAQFLAENGPVVGIDRLRRRNWPRWSGCRRFPPLFPLILHMKSERKI